MTKSVALLASIFLALVASAPAGAAVRSCKPTVVSGPFVADAEMAARKGALAGWVEKAGGHGVAFTSWRLADQRSIRCERRAQGAFACVAAGAPCRIEHVPPLPKGKQRLAVTD